MRRLVLMAPGATPELSDASLVAACATGDRAALAQLFDRHHVALYRFCQRILGAEQDVEDVVQTVFLEAWQRADRFRGEASVRAWLLAIVANLSRKLIRKSENRAAVLASLLVEPPPERLPTDRLAEQRELVRRIPAALARLPHELRVVYAMVELEQLSGAEAARVLGIPPGTAWRRLHQARRALLALIAEVP